MMTHISIYALLNGLLLAAICIRVLTYQRGNSSYKPIISAMAAIMVFATGAESFLCLTGLEKCVTLPQLIITAGMTIAILAHKGNVSRCLPLPKHKREILRGTTKFSRRVT